MSEDYNIELRNNIIFFLIIIIVISLFFLQRYSKEKQKVNFDSSSKIHYINENDARSIIKDRAEITIRALKFKNFSALNQLIHPKKGLRLSPYSYIIAKDIIIKQNEIFSLYEDENIKIENMDRERRVVSQSFKEYYQNYIYPHDYANYDKISFNNPYKSENVIDNIREYYPKAILVEFQLNDTNPNNLEKDWSVLRLAYEEYKDEWYLVGIVNITGINK